jgi:YidC/Oxa1 family membrane protein insertase
MLIEGSYHLTELIGLPNYGLAIILITILIKLVMFPLTNRQMKSMQGMKMIQPKIKAIQERYQHDKEKMNQKIMETYKEYDVHPLGGCLPLLLQLPIFFAFYQALLGMAYSVPEHARFLWIPNIGQPDPYYVIAVVAGLTTFLQQRQVMVDAKDGMQRNMLYFMPAMMGFIALTLPAGLPLYWIIFNILGILQQYWLNRKNTAAIVSPPADEKDERDQDNGRGDTTDANRGKKGKKRK